MMAFVIWACFDVPEILGSKSRALEPELRSVMFEHQLRTASQAYKMELQLLQLDVYHISAGFSEQKVESFSATLM